MAMLLHSALLALSCSGMASDEIAESEKWYIDQFHQIEDQETAVMDVLKDEQHQQLTASLEQTQKMILAEIKKGDAKTTSPK